MLMMTESFSSSFLVHLAYLSSLPGAESRLTATVSSLSNSSAHIFSKVHVKTSRLPTHAYIDAIASYSSSSESPSASALPPPHTQQSLSSHPATIACNCSINPTAHCGQGSASLIHVVRLSVSPYLILTMSPQLSSGGNVELSRYGRSHTNLGDMKKKGRKKRKKRQIVQSII